MKKKIFFFVTVFVLLAQTIFAGPYEEEFAKMFTANDMSGIEWLLRNYGCQMDLQVCLNTVNYSLARLYDYPFILGDPLTRNRNSIFRAMQLLVDAGVDLNVRVGGLYVITTNRQLGYQRSTAFSDILSTATMGTSQSDAAIVRFLLDSGANWTNNYQLFPTGNDEHILVARVLIEYGYNVNRIGPDEGALPVLYSAASSGSIATVRLLIESGAMVNQQAYNGKTAAQIAYENGKIDIYNHLKQNGAVWSPPSQVASTPPSSSQPRTTYNDTYDYTPPPSNPSGSSTPPRNVGREIAEAFRSPIQSGTYAVAGTQLRIRISAIARSGILTYTNLQGRSVQGTFNIDGNRMTIQAEGYTYVYSITSETSFSGHNETWVRTGY
jgi:hypothetical protein